MIVRFCLYSILKNLRFFEPFFVFYLLVDLRLSYFEIGALVGFQKLLTGLLEIPLGVATDRWGRRRALAACFGCYVVAFPIYALAGDWTRALQTPLLYLAQSVFGIGEALRTGSHKAIMLDWVDQGDRPIGATRLIAVTRFFSKTSAGVSALAGGAVVYFTGTFYWLFWAATVPSALGVMLMLSYPRSLEGEQVRMGADRERTTWRQRFKNLWVMPGLAFLMLQSILFESQIKLAQHYIQPFLKEAFDEVFDEPVAVAGGVGALLIGLYYLAQDGFGGVSSIASSRVEKALGGGSRALQVLYLAAAAIAILVAASLFQQWLLVGLVGFMLLAGLQNARRPIFVAQFNQVMDKPQRATTLSIESQGRSWSYALLAPLTGWMADHWGLPWVFVTFSGILVAGILLNLLPRKRVL